MVKIREVYKENWKDPQEITNLVKQYLKPYSLNMPCGTSPLGDLKADIEPTLNPDIITDMYRPKFKNNTFDSIYSDPPWNIGYDKRIPLAYTLRDLLKPGGVLIYNAPWIPKVKGLYIEKIFLTITSNMMPNVSVISILRKANQVLI